MLEGVACASAHRHSSGKASGRISGNGGHDQCHDHEAREEIRREKRRLAQKGSARQTRIRSIQPSFVEQHISPQSDIRCGEQHVFDDSEPQRIRRIGLIGKKGGANASDEQHSCGDRDQYVPCDAQRHGNTFGRRTNGIAQRNGPSRMRVSAANRRGSIRIARRCRHDAAETAAARQNAARNARASAKRRDGSNSVALSRTARTGSGMRESRKPSSRDSGSGSHPVRQKYSSIPSAYTSLRTVVCPKPNCSGGA